MSWGLPGGCGGPGQADVLAAVLLARQARPAHGRHEVRGRGADVELQTPEVVLAGGTLERLEQALVHTVASRAVEHQLRAGAVQAGRRGAAAGRLSPPRDGGRARRGA